MHHVGIAITTLGLFTALLLCLMLPMYNKSYKGIGHPTKDGIERTFKGGQTHYQGHLHNIANDTQGRNEQHEPHY